MKSIVLAVALLFATTLIAASVSKMDLIKQAQMEVGEISPKKLKSLLDEDEDVIVLDVRESEQRAEGGLKGWAKAGYPVKTGLGVTILQKK